MRINKNNLFNFGITFKKTGKKKLASPQLCPNFSYVKYQEKIFYGFCFLSNLWDLMGLTKK